MARNGKEIDVSLGGVEFRLATSQETPYVSETIPIRKEQFDTEADPGEQSLTGWWRRSQSSYHEGAGNLYAEARGGLVDIAGFHGAYGVSVATPGELTLSPALEEATGNPYIVNMVRTSHDNFVALTYDTSSSSYAVQVSSAIGINGPGDLTWTTVPTSTAAEPDLIIDYYDRETFEGYVLIVCDNGTRVEKLVPKSPLPATSTPLFSSTEEIRHIAVMKRRIWLIDSKFNLYQLPLDHTTNITATDSFGTLDIARGHTPVRSVVETPGAIFYGYGRRIYAVTVDEATFDPAAPVIVAEVPVDEGIAALSYNLGYLLIAHTEGFRLASINGTNLTLGPKIATSVSYYLALARSIAIVGTKFLVPATQSDPNLPDSFPKDGIFAFDLGNMVGELQPAWHQWLSLGESLSWVGVVTTTLGDAWLWYRLAGVDYLAHMDRYVYANSSGALLTGRIRFRMTEAKLFKYVNVTFDRLPAGASVTVGIYDTNGNYYVLGAEQTVGATTTGPLAIPDTLGPQQHIQVLVELTTTTDDPPVVREILVRAIPSVAPQRQFQVPLLCFDYEQSKSGHRYGKDGYALERLETLRELEDVGDTIDFIEYAGSTETTRKVVIDGLRYIETSSPPPGASGRGGILVATLRTVEV